MTSRRSFIQIIPFAGALALSARGALAAAPAVSETDPLAVSMGYKADNTKVDKKKFPKYAAGQSCSSCALYQGKAGDASGPCPIFSNKAVSSKGWCNSYVKKA